MQQQLKASLATKNHTKKQRQLGKSGKSFVMTKGPNGVEKFEKMEYFLEKIQQTLIFNTNKLYSTLST